MITQRLHFARRTGELTYQVMHPLVKASSVCHSFRGAPREVLKSQRVKHLDHTLLKLMNSLLGYEPLRYGLPGKGLSRLEQILELLLYGYQGGRQASPGQEIDETDASTPVSLDEVLVAQPRAKVGNDLVGRFG